MTIKQEKAIDILAGNGGNVTQAMLEAGYSPATANTPGKLTDSKGFKELMEAIMPDTLITERHRNLLEQKRVDYFVFPKTMSDEEIVGHVNASGLEVITVRTSDKGKMAFYTVADAMAISKAIDMAYKLKGSYAPEKSVTLNLTETAPDPELDKLRQEFNERAKQRIIDQIKESA